MWRLGQQRGQATESDEATPRSWPWLARSEGMDPHSSHYIPSEPKARKAETNPKQNGSLSSQKRKSTKLHSPSNKGLAWNHARTYQEAAHSKFTKRTIWQRAHLKHQTLDLQTPWRVSAWMCARFVIHPEPICPGTPQFLCPLNP